MNRTGKILSTIAATAVNPALGLVVGVCLAAEAIQRTPYEWRQEGEEWHMFSPEGNLIARLVRNRCPNYDGTPWDGWLSEFEPAYWLYDGGWHAVDLYLHDLEKAKGILAKQAAQKELH